MCRLVSVFLFALCLVPSAAATQQPPTGATRSGFAVARLARIDSTFQRSIDAKRMAGAALLILRDGKVVYDRAVGWADRESRRPMTTSSIFRIASQTKAITSVAIMMLAEEGKVALNDPVSRFIPAYAQTTVAMRADTGRTIVPARRRITIRDLLTHTAGISYGTDELVAPLYAAKGFGSAAGRGWYFADKDEPICTSIERLASLPFVAQPGERYVYGYATDVLGCVVERASGMSLDEFVRTRITGPLGMHDTHFFLPAEKRGRLTTVYASSGDSLVPAPAGPLGQGHYVEGPRRSFSGGAGLLSTTRDYARFLQMLLNGGTLDGVRLLAPKTVQLLTSNQVGTLFSQTGLGFSLAFRTWERTGADGGVQTIGSYAWGGAYGSQYHVDPKEGIIYLFMVQLLPGNADISEKLPMLVYQALVEPRAR